MTLSENRYPLFRVMLCTKERKGSGTPTDAEPYLRTFRCGARFAKRARLWAFHHGSCPREYFIPRAQPGPGFVTHRPNAAGLPASPCGTSSDAPRAPVIVPAG